MDPQPTDDDTTILVVDDNLSNLQLMLQVLENFYNVTSIRSGEECLERLDEINPDLIYMDVKMPGIDGYETCQKIRAIEKYRELPILFLSAHVGLEDKLAGYDAGGDDYLTKPFEVEELLAKARVSLEQKKKRDAKFDETCQVAQVAMTNSGELGVVLQCYQDCLTCRTYFELSENLLSACSEFGLNCCIQIRGELGTINVATCSITCKPIEVELMSKLAHEDRILYFGKRMAFNYNRITLIVKNLPDLSEERWGRVRDHVTSLLSCVDIRVREIDIAEEQERLVLDRVKSSIHDIDRAIQSIEELFHSRGQVSTRLIDELLTKMNVGFGTLALSEEQENFFIDLVNTHMAKIIDQYTVGREIDQFFDLVSKKLSLLVEESEKSRQLVAAPTHFSPAQGKSWTQDNARNQLF